MNVYFDWNSFANVFPEFDTQGILIQAQQGFREWWATAGSPVEPRYAGTKDCGGSMDGWQANTVCIRAYSGCSSSGGCYASADLEREFYPVGQGEISGGLKRGRITLYRNSIQAQVFTWDINGWCAPPLKQEFRSTITHEIGHALGLGDCDGYTTDAGTAMVQAGYDVVAPAECQAEPRSSRTQRYPKYDDIYPLVNSIYPSALTSPEVRSSPDAISWSYWGQLNTYSRTQVSQVVGSGGLNGWVFVDKWSPYGIVKTAQSGTPNDLGSGIVSHGRGHGSPAITYKSTQFNIAMVSDVSPRHIWAQKTTTWPNTWSQKVESSVSVDDGMVELVYDPISTRFVFLWRGHDDRLWYRVSTDGVTMDQLSGYLSQEILHGPKMECLSQTDANGYNCVMVYAKADAYGCAAWSRAKVSYDPFLKKRFLSIGPVNTYCYAAWTALDVAPMPLSNEFLFIFNQGTPSWVQHMSIGESGWHDVAYVSTLTARTPSLAQDWFEFYTYY